MSGMADESVGYVISVLRGHMELTTAEAETVALAVIDTLSAAGFGLVREAQAVALKEAADAILTNDPLDFWDQHLPEGLGWQEAMSRWLKAHARAMTVRGGE